MAGSPAPEAVPGSVVERSISAKGHKVCSSIQNIAEFNYVNLQNICTSLAVALGGSMRSIMMLLGL